MDKNVYNMKVEKIQKQAKLGDYETAAKICDTIDWSQVSSVRMLVLVSSVYEHVGNYDAAIDILLMAYEEAPVGRRFMYKLTELAIASGNIREAEEYYKNYLKEAPHDNSRYLLRYLLAEAKGEALDKRITILETYKKYEFEEEWAFRLAVLYYKADRREECVALCDEIILWFGVGPYVDMAMELKEQYEPLNEYQRERRENKAYYEENLNRMAQESDGPQEAYSHNSPVQEEVEASAEKEYVEAEYETQDMVYEDYPEDPVSYEEELPRVVISDESNGLYTSQFDDAAFIAEEEAAAADSMGNTREVVDSGVSRRELVFHHVEESETSTLEQSLGALVQNLLREEEQAGEPEVVPEAVLEEIIPADVSEDSVDQVAEEPVIDSEAARAEEIFREEFKEEIPAEMTEEVETELIQEEEELPVIQVEQLELVWEDMDEEVSEPAKGKDLIFLGTPSSAEGIHMAVDALRKAYEAEGGELAQVAKISGSKLNMKGLIKSLPNLKGKDLIIDNANSLEDVILHEIEKVRTEIEPEKRFVLMDRPAGIYRLKERLENLDGEKEDEDLPKIFVSDEFVREEKTEEAPAREEVRTSHPEVKVRPRNRDAARTEDNAPVVNTEITPSAADKKEIKADAEPEAVEPPVRKEEPVGKKESSKPAKEPKKSVVPVLPEGPLDEDMELTEEQFVAYIKRYAAEIDCVIEEVAVLALYKVIEEIQEDGDRLTVGVAEEVVEEAADEAERKTLRSVFGSRYDKEGRLILKERHF